jgi:pyridoxine 5-phosphate synthase
MAIRLHINIDHVATLRNARGSPYPDPVFAAKLCEVAGADGITAHLREDRRHIRDDDIERLRASLVTPLNLEAAPVDEMIAIAERVVPEAVTLVPERREERTTEGGLDVLAARAQVQKAALMCERAGVKLSLFIEADTEQIRASRDLGARQIELHTGDYALAQGTARAERLTRLRSAAVEAHRLGLEVAAGHGLTVHNLVDIAAISEVVELNIGHAAISDALFVGLERAVRAFRKAIERGLARR